MGTLRTRLLLREMLGVMVERMPSPESAENLGSADKDVPRKKAAPWGISKQSPRVATPSPAVKAKVGADTAPKLIYGKIGSERFGEGHVYIPDRDKHLTFH